MELAAAPLIAAGLALLLTPLVGRLAICVGAVDRPDARRAHARPTPTCGGVAIFAGFWTSMAVAAWPFSRPDLVLLGASGALLVICIVDDLRGLSPILRLSAQFGLAAALWWLGDVRVLGVTWPFGGEGVQYLHMGRASLPVTALWIVLIVNALNWLDGLDGLAAGVAAIAATTLAVLAAAMGAAQVAVMGAALAGATLGFLRYNVKPASIFMGDAGAMFLGLILACMAVNGALKSATVVTIAGPLLALAVPIYDVLSTSIRRLIGGQPVHLADRQHVHHRLLDRGWSEQKVVMALWCMAGLLSVLGLVLLR